MPARLGSGTIRPWNEWVIVLKGGAGLRFEDEPGERAMADRRLHLHPRKETPPRRVDQSLGANGLARRSFRVSESARTGLRNQFTVPHPVPLPASSPRRACWDRVGTLELSLRTIQGSLLPLGEGQDEEMGASII